MNTLMMALQTIALLCGSTVQTSSTGAVSMSARSDAKQCQVQMIKCLQAKTEGQSTLSKDYEKSLAQCVQETR